MDRFIGKRAFAFVLLSLFIFSLWVIEFVDAMEPRLVLDMYGIIPRTVHGLDGIVYAPFLHGGAMHLEANTGGLLTFGTILIITSIDEALGVSVFTVIFGGGMTWLLAPGGAVHIGASGLIFGMYGFLLARGFFQKDFLSLGLSTLIIVLYGGMLFGVLPSVPGVSWQMHLFGFIGGVLYAWRTAQKVRRSRRNDTSSRR